MKKAKKALWEMTKKNWGLVGLLGFVIAFKKEQKLVVGWWPQGSVGSVIGCMFVVV